MNTVINILKQKKERKPKNPKTSLLTIISSQVKMMVMIPETIKILRVFFEKLSEYVPEIMMAVKMMSLMSNRLVDKDG